MRSVALLIIALMLFIPAPLYAESLLSISHPSLQSEAAYLFDVQSGQIIYENNSTKKLAPASTTKIMTALLALEHGKLDDVITVSDTVKNQKLVYGTRINLQPGEKITLNDLLYALLLNSANDAAVVIAEAIGGDVPHFVEMMNAKAAELGANDTYFVNPSGLSDMGHTTTARDLALIAKAAYFNPQFREYVQTKEHQISRTQFNSTDMPVDMVNENKLLWRNPEVNGLKTGYTSEALNTFVASATRDNRTLIGVTLKSPGGTMWDDMNELLNYGFTTSSNVVYKPAGETIDTITVASQPLDLVLKDPIYLTQMPDGQLPNIQLHVLPLANELSQIQQGEEITQLEVMSNQTLLETVPLIASKTIMPVPQSFPRLFYLEGFLGVIGMLFLFIGYRKMVIKKRRKLRYRKRINQIPLEIER